MTRLPDIATTPRLLRLTAQRHGDHVAIEDDGHIRTWRQLQDDVLRVARALIAQGIAHGDRVAIWAPNWHEWIVAALGLHSVGAVLVPVNTRMKGAEAGDILARSGARILFCAGDFLGENYPRMLAAHRPETLEHLIVFRGVPPQAHGESWDTFLRRGDAVSASTALERMEAVGEDDLSDLLYTSGTTGRAKGVMTAHGQNLRLIEQWAAAIELAADDRYLIAAPFFHAFGYKAGWLAAMLCGATILPHSVFDAAQVLARIERDRISVLPGPPTLFHSLLAEPLLASTDLSSLRATVTGAAAIEPALIERIRSELGFEIVLSGYGLTEACGFVTMCRRGDSAETVAHTSGRALQGVELRIADAQGSALPQGETGEIWVRGYNVMRGYYNDTEATAEAIDADGWLHTGDVGHLDKDGYLAITDRIKDMYICGGFNCYPAEIERLLAEHPAIAQSAVIGIPDVRMGEVGCAYVVARNGAVVNADILIRWCREHMTNYKVPRRIIFVDSLPVNASGKVLKSRLRELAKRPNSVDGG